MTTALMAGYNVAVVPALAQAFQRLYITNDFDAIRVTDDGLTIRTAGIAAPTVTPTVAGAAGGSAGVGTHLVRYRYYDSTRERLSDPSTAVSITIASGTQTINVTPTASADAYVNKIIIEITAAGATAYYRSATVANATALTGFSSTDAILIALPAAATYGDFQHQPPPLAALICEHRGRTWLWGTTTRTFTGVTVTNGSTAVNGAGFSTQWAGRQMVGPDSATYVIVSATTTVITLTAVYAGGNTVGTITVKSGSPSLLCWARATYPESFDPTTFARQITLASGDVPAAMFSYYSDLYLVGQRSMRRLAFTSDPTAGMVLAIPGNMGAFHQRCICTAAPGLIFGWGRDGIWQIESMQPENMSAPVEQTLASLADPSTSVRFVRYEPTHRAVLFFFALTGETSCRAALAYFVDKRRWQIWYFRQGMTTGCQNSAYADRQRLMISDVNGYSWRMGVSTNDGGGQGVMAATNASATVITGANSAIPGQMAYRPATSEARLITAATPTQITVSAFTAPTTIGEAIWIGSIRTRLLSQWFIGDDTALKKRPQWLLIKVVANRTAGQKMGTIQVRFYADYDLASPLAFSSISADLWPNGITVVNGATYITADLDVGGLDGYIPIPMPDSWQRAIACEVIAETPYNGIRFYDVTFTADSKLAQGLQRNE